jgi:glycosyltransferase involved in cell wall biosynthesis
MGQSRPSSINDRICAVKPRILHIIPSLDRSGTERQLSLLAAALPRDRFDVHICALDNRGNDHSPGEIPIASIGKSWTIDPLAYARLKRHIRRLAPDIVHTWSFTANLYGRTAGRAAGVRRIVAGERRIEQSRTGFRFAIDKQLHRYTDCVVTSSQGVSEACVQNGLPEQKVRLIPNAVEPIRANEFSKQQLCLEVGIPADSRLMIAVGNLRPHKRFKDLIWAADLLKCVRDDTHLLIVGDGPQRWRLERYRRQCEITDRVHFLGHREDVPELLSLCECFWSASDDEGQSNAIMEAMSAALPVVATNIHGNCEVMMHRESGFLIPVGDRAGFAKWTNVLLDDQELSLEMGRRGQKRMRDEFSVERMVGLHVQLYEELLN